MKLLITFTAAFLFAINYFNISPLKTNFGSVQKSEIISQQINITHRLLFKEAKTKYDTLIPLFKGLFATYDYTDTNFIKALNFKSYQDSFMALVTGTFITKETKKWGVIDSTGKVIVPFICDGVKAISDSMGVASVYYQSFSLNTGIPRYMYFVKYFFFTKDGREKKEKEFNIKIEFLADWHQPGFVISQGPEFYLPEEYRKVRR